MIFRLPSIRGGRSSRCTPAEVKRALAQARQPSCVAALINQLGVKHVKADILVDHLAALDDAAFSEGITLAASLPDAQRSQARAVKQTAARRFADDVAAYFASL